MNKTVNVKNITLISMGIALNVVGAFIALNLRLPIYLDSIGTILIACMLGPKYAVITGVGGSLVSGMTFDIYSLYFAPVQITTGYLAGIMYKNDMLKGVKNTFRNIYIYLTNKYNKCNNCSILIWWSNIFWFFIHSSNIKPF